MNHPTTVAAEGVTARESWENIAQDLKREAYHCLTAKEWAQGFEGMHALLRELIDKHGQDAVLKSCAWAFLGFHPAYRD